jgi:hypothetical protein
MAPAPLARRDAVPFTDVPATRRSRASSHVLDIRRIESAIARDQFFTLQRTDSPTSMPRHIA